MFTENERISSRQLYRSMVVTLAGPTLLVCPRVAGQYGADGFLVYLIAGALSVGYVGLVLWLRGLLQKYGTGSDGRGIMFLEGLVRVLVIGKLLLLAIGTMYLICDVVTGILLPETHVLMVLGVLALGLIYWHQGSVECSARAFEMLYYWVVVPIVIVVALALPKVNVSNLTPQLNTGVGELVLAAVFLWFLFTPAELLILCRDHFPGSSDRKATGNVWKGVIVLIVGNLITYGTVLGIYGGNTLCDGSPYPLLKVMQISGVPGDFLRRVDGFMSVFLVLSLFCAMAMLLDYTGINIWKFRDMLFCHRREKSYDGQNKKMEGKVDFLKYSRRKIIFSIMVVAIMVAATLPLREQGIFRQPATGQSDIYGEKKVVSSVELEERAFVMSIIIGDETVTFEIASDEQDMWQEKSQYVTLQCRTVEEAELLYKENGDKRLDFTQLKLIFMENSVLQDASGRRNIEYMYLQEKYAENVLVCPMDGDLEDMAASAMDSGEALAVKVENILEKAEKSQGMELYVVYGAMKLQ